MVAAAVPHDRPRLGTTWASRLGLVPECSFGAHWDRARFVPGMRGFVMSRNRRDWFAGIDERAAILRDGSRRQVFGAGTVSLRLDGTTVTFRAGDRFSTSP